MQCSGTLSPPRWDPELPSYLDGSTTVDSGQQLQKREKQAENNDAVSDIQTGGLG